VDSSNLQPWQARKIFAALQRATGYLSRLKRRMEVTGFPPHDPLFLATVKAHRAMQDLLMELHYLSCESGVWRRPGPRKK
jgi:hypothetical protein